MPSVVPGGPVSLRISYAGSSPCQAFATTQLGTHCIQSQLNHWVCLIFSLVTHPRINPALWKHHITWVILRKNCEKTSPLPPRLSTSRCLTFHRHWQINRSVGLASRFYQWSNASSMLSVRYEIQTDLVLKIRAHKSMLKFFITCTTQQTIYLTTTLALCCSVRFI